MESILQQWIHLALYVSLSKIIYLAMHKNLLNGISMEKLGLMRSKLPQSALEKALMNMMNSN
jgi:hypothetical protein